MRLDRSLLRRARELVREQRWVALACAVALLAILVASWFVSLATQPVRYSTPRLEMAGYGLPDVELGLTYPERLSVQPADGQAEFVTVAARALNPGAVASLDLALPLSDDAIAFTDVRGEHVPARLTVVPGYPDALPYDLRVVHGNTQLQGGLVRSYRVEIVPVVRAGELAVPIPELTLRIRLMSLAEQAVRRLATALVTRAAPYLLLVALLGLGSWVGLHVSRRQRLRREKYLATLHSRLREQIKLQHWSDARNEIERLRLQKPHYRDVDQLDAIVSAAETATWRREQLYQAGVRAYRGRDWPTAVQSFAAVEQETPYYHDVRFLRRTAALYADLASRDRSRRISAARELGEVADLVDMQPLLAALGDPSAEVNDAAQAALHKIGPAAMDDLLAGLVHSLPRVREGAYRLIEQLGQSARESLLAALHSSDPGITRQAANLLAALGARKELAESLLWIPGHHLAGVVAALRREGDAVAGVLVDVLLKASTERQQVVINALAALKQDADVDRRLDEALRAARTPQEKAVLQKACVAQAATFLEPSDGALAPAALPGASPQTPATEAGGHAKRPFWRMRPNPRLEAACPPPPAPSGPQPKE